MDWESQEDGYIAKILAGDGSKDIAVGTPVLIFVENKVGCHLAVDLAEITCTSCFVVGLLLPHLFFISKQCQHGGACLLQKPLLLRIFCCFASADAACRILTSQEIAHERV